VIPFLGQRLSVAGDAEDQSRREEACSNSRLGVGPAGDRLRLDVVAGQLDQLDGATSPASRSA
jgi:hypothetical protein